MYADLKILLWLSVCTARIWSMCCTVESVVLQYVIPVVCMCLCGCLTSESSLPALWPYAPAAERWNPTLQWCSRCSAWYPFGSGYMSPTKKHLMLNSNIQHLSYSQTFSYKQLPRLQSLPNFQRDWYLFIDELQLQRVCSRVHVDGHLSSQTPGLILHQNWAVCESQEIEKY